jgi:periplasmic divalent cation tolerance protein
MYCFAITLNGFLVFIAIFISCKVKYLSSELSSIYLIKHLKLFMEKIVVLITSPSKYANKIAKHLIENRLAACVNILDARSIFIWQGIESAREKLLIAKTRKDKLDELIKKVKEIHPYKVPEIIALPIIDGLKDYLNWIDDSLLNYRI